MLKDGEDWHGLQINDELENFRLKHSITLRVGRDCEYEYEIWYEYDFLILVSRLRIITSHTSHKPVTNHNFLNLLRTNMKSE